MSADCPHSSPLLIGDFVAEHIPAAVAFPRNQRRKIFSENTGCSATEVLLASSRSSFSIQDSSSTISSRWSDLLIGHWALSVSCITLGAESCPKSRAPPSNPIAKYSISSGKTGMLAAPSCLERVRYFRSGSGTVNFTVEIRDSHPKRSAVLAAKTADLDRIFIIAMASRKFSLAHHVRRSKWALAEFDFGAPSSRVSPTDDEYTSISHRGC